MSDIANSPFANLLAAPGIFTSAKRFDKSGEILEIQNSIGFTWQRAQKMDEDRHLWSAVSAADDLGSFVGEVTRTSNGGLKIETETECYIMQSDGSWLHAYKYGLVESWNQSTLTLTSTMTDQPGVCIKYSINPLTRRLTECEAGAPAISTASQNGLVAVRAEGPSSEQLYLFSNSRNMRSFASNQERIKNSYR